VRATELQLDTKKMAIHLDGRILNGNPEAIQKGQMEP